MRGTDVQQLEGFAAVVDRPEVDAVTWRVGPDQLDRRPAQLSPDWWRAPGAGGAPVVWRTAPARESAAAAFVFAAESSNISDADAVTTPAALFVDGAEVLTFEIGIRIPRTWETGLWKLHYEPTGFRGEAEGYHRQFEAGGCAGVYELSAPAGAVHAGQPLELAVWIRPQEGTRPHVWFALRDRTDLLAAPLAEKQEEHIARLEKELDRLNCIVGNLARRSYADLLPERLPTEDVTIYTNGWRHVHQTDVVRLGDQELLVTTREGSEHISNDGTIVNVRSLDGGRTWSEAEVVRAHPNSDERESSLALLSDGTVLMNEWVNTFYDERGRYRGGVRESGEQRSLSVLGPAAPGRRRPGIYVARSSDGGRTWTWQEEPIDSSRALHTSERVVELPSGRLLMICYFSNEVRIEGVQGRRMGVSLITSDDRGTTWSADRVLADLPDVSLAEPALLRLRSGRLLSVIRNETRPGSPYYQVTSDDAGETWSRPAPTAIPGFRNPVSLVQLDDGRVLCIYGAREDPAGMYVVASEDDGETWDLAHRRILRDDQTNFDLGYPSSVLMPDGSVFATYYINLFHRYFIVGSKFRFD